MLGVACAVCFAKGVSTRDEGDCFFVIHGHASECFADISRRGDRVGVAIRAFGIHINEAHLHGGKRVFQFAVASVALVLKPFSLGAPVNVLFGFPDVGASAGKAEGFKTHRIQGHIASEDHQVGPRNFASVFLFDRPEQAACFVEIAIVWPAVERREALAAISSASASITSAVGAGAMPGHANEKRAVVAEIRRPPILRVGHEIG